MIKTVKTDRFEMEYISFGNGGKPLIVLPGISLKPVITNESGLNSLFGRFTASHTVYVFERRKCMPEDFTVFGMADDMAEAMKTLKMPPADIYGASQGGMIALVLAAKYPNQVSNVVPVSSLYRPNEKSKAAFGKWISLYEEGRYEDLNRSMFEGIYSDEYLNKFSAVFAKMIKDGTQEEFSRLYTLLKACSIFDATDFMEKIECPVFALGSLSDKVIDGNASKEIANAVKNGRFYLYDGFSHAVYDEDPDFLARVYTFLNENI